MSISDVITLITGIALFLFGMSLMGEGLKKVSGNKLEPILYKLSGTPIKGILLGCGVTAVIQSSSATSVMAVGFVNSGMMKIRQAIYVIMGAILGTSITGWIVCLSYIPGSSGIGSLLSTATLTGIIAAVGIILRMFSKKQIRQQTGNILMGFAVLMFGMSTMSGAVSTLGEQEWFTSALTTLSNPILGIVIGAAFAAVLQSASAAVGIIQALSVTGAMTMEIALPLLMGITIGASLPVLLSALGAGTDGKRTAVSYLVASFMGVMVCASVFYICEAIFRFSFLETVMNPFSLALLNTLFRLVIVLILAPFTDVIEAISALLVRNKKEDDMTLKLEERFLSHPALAVEQSRQAICDMAMKTKEAVNEATALINAFSPARMEKVRELEETGDRYEDALGTYLMELSGRGLTEPQGRKTSVFLNTLSDFERISDHAMNIAEGAQEMHDKKISFSEDASRELSVITAAVKDILQITADAFINEDVELAGQVEPLEEVIDDLRDEMKLHHVERLQLGLCTIENGFVFNDLLTDLERISDHCSNVAVAIIELREGALETHEYLENIKEKRNPDFEKYYNRFREMYGIDLPA